MTFTETRIAFIRHSMNVTATWIDELEQELTMCAVGGSTEQFNKLERLVQQEKQLYDELRATLRTNLEI